MATTGGTFTDMTAEEWVDYELARQEKWIDDIANLEWDEFVEMREALTAHMAKAQVLITVKKKLQQSKKS